MWLHRLHPEILPQDELGHPLAPGGRLIYAVCSLEREEGEAQAAGVTLPADPVLAEDLPDWLAPTPEGWLRTDPGLVEGGMDGFFIARWRA